MSYQEAIKYFTALNVCRVSNWQEIRIKGKFLRVADTENSSIEQVVSKWYYTFNVDQPQTRVFIGVHQEDERAKGVLLRRPYIDIAIALLRKKKDSFEIVDLKDFA